MTEISPKQAVKYVRNLSDQPDYDFIYKNSSDNSKSFNIQNYVPKVPRYKAPTYYGDSDANLSYYIIPINSWDDFDPVVFNIPNMAQNSSMLWTYQPWYIDYANNGEMKNRVERQNVVNPYTGSKCLANNSHVWTYITQNIRQGGVPFARDSGIGYMWSLWWHPEDVNNMQGQGLQFWNQVINMNGGESQWGNSFWFGPQLKGDTNNSNLNNADGSFERTTGITLQNGVWYYLFGFIDAGNKIYQNLKRADWNHSIFRWCVGIPDRSYISDPSLAAVHLGNPNSLSDQDRKIRQNLINFPMAIVPTGGDSY